MKELQKYRQIGTNEEFARLKEKDTPHLVMYESIGDYDGKPVYDIAYCPNCNARYEEDYDGWYSDYCPKCGKALLWEAETRKEKNNG